MRYLTLLLLILSSYITAHSQTYEVGGFFGGANVIGDVGNTTYINPNTPAVGAFFRWNRSKRHSFRFSASYAKIEGDDTKSSEERRKQRGFAFENSIKEASLGMEYTFWEFNLNSGAPAAVPYLYTGITYFIYDAKYSSRNDINAKVYDKSSSFAIPMVLGYKATLGTKLIAAFEIGARYTFTDGLDSSVGVEGLADDEGLRFGNTNNNDWYMFTGITLSVTFGREPCYCNF